MLFKVFHLQPTTMFETQDLWALTLQIPQLYPVDVTPEIHDYRHQNFMSQDESFESQVRFFLCTSSNFNFDSLYCLPGKASRQTLQNVGFE